MLRALAVAFSGIIYFILSLPMMIPLRIKPIENYNLFYVPFLAIVLIFLFYRACTVKKESKSYIYGFFAAIFTWQLFGEVASIPVPKGYITQFSALNIKILGGYFYVVGGWIFLLLLWRTKALKNSICVYLMTFLGLWTYELYMDNYSSNVSLEMMPIVANYITVASVIATGILLYVARKTPSIEKKTVMGCLLYLTISVLLMAPGQWKKPQSFYIKYEAAHIEHEIEALKEERAKIIELKKYMISEGLLESNELEKQSEEEETDTMDQ
jgi:hypothetical protein